jgi:hypothetical protein
VKRSGIADLPLHGGRVPAWLATRMVTLGTAISESVLHHYGRSALLTRLSDSILVPGAWLGDGHGLALLRHHDVGHGRAEERPQPARPRARGLYLWRPWQAFPKDARRVALDSRSHKASTATRWSGRAASRREFDNNAIADGFQIYLHTFVLTADGEWAVVQQGMNESSRLARR